MQNTSPAHDATLLSAARAFVALADAFSIIGDGPADNQALDAHLGAIWEPRMAVLGEVTTNAAGSPEAVRWKAEALRRLLAA